MQQPTSPNNVAGDQTDKAMQPVKEAYREEWLNSDNKIFITKLNHLCNNYDKNTNDVSVYDFEM